MGDDLKDSIRKILAICSALSTIIAAALIFRVMLLPSWENLGEAMLFTFLAFVSNWYEDKIK